MTRLDADRLTWLHLPARHESLESFREFVLQHAEEVSFPAGRLFKLEVALEELLVNVINYAYSEEEEGSIVLGCGPMGDRLFCLRIRDRGVPFNPLDRAQPDLSLGVDEREIGGLGIYFALKIADTAHYERKDGWNELTLLFNLDSRAQPAD